MPTYNCASYISDAIKSILNQTYKEFEFLIIDDGSTDNTKEIVYSFNDSRIRYIKKGNTGLSDSLNYGLRVASNDLIARMDADDISLPGRLETQLKYLKENQQYDIISSWYGILYKKKIKYIIKTPTEDKEIKKGLLLHSYSCHAAVLYNRNVILKHGGYRDVIFEDYDLWLRLMNQVNFYNIPQILYLLRFRKDSLSRNNMIERYKDQYSLQAKYYDDLKYYFNISKGEEIINRGWREYFYGDKKKARKYWKNCLFINLNYKLYLAYIITFLPGNIFISFKEARIRYRVEYYLHYFEGEAKNLRQLIKLIRKSE